MPPLSQSRDDRQSELNVALNNDSDMVRQWAIQALMSQKIPDQFLFDKLFRIANADEDAAVRAVAMEALAATAPTPVDIHTVLVPFWRYTFKNSRESPEVRYRAAVMWSRKARDTSGERPYFMRMLHDESEPPALRRAAISVLTSDQQALEQSLPMLIRIAGGTDQPIAFRHEAIEALRIMGPKASAAVPVLIEIVESELDLPICQTAIKVLGQMGSAAASALPVLERISQNPQADNLLRLLADTQRGIIMKSLR